MATPRDARVSSVLAWVVEGIEAEGRWLVVDDRAGEVVPAFPPEVQVESWFRAAYDGIGASPEPPPGPYDGIVLRLPRGADAFRMMSHQLMAQLGPDGQLVVGGANDEGIRPVAQRLLDVAEHTEVVATRRHCRVVQARGARADLRPELAAWAQTVEATVGDVQLAWASWPSLFAHGRLDPGTRLLLDTLPPLEGPVLDFACGAGVIAQFLTRRGDDVQLHLSDVDALALHAARQNVPEAHAWSLSDGLPVEGGPFAAIVSNPPLHLGKDGHRGVLEALAGTAPHRLRPKGQLILVVQGTVPVQRTLADAFGSVVRLAKTPSYAVWCAQPGRR